MALSPNPLAFCAGMDWRPDRLDPFNYACFLGLMDLVRTTWEATPPNKFVQHLPRPSRVGIHHVARPTVLILKRARLCFAHRADSLGALAQASDDYEVSS